VIVLPGVPPLPPGPGSGKLRKPWRRGWPLVALRQIDHDDAGPQRQAGCSPLIDWSLPFPCALTAFAG
jgi:hypothetical protein